MWGELHRLKLHCDRKCLQPDGSLSPQTDLLSLIYLVLSILWSVCLSASDQDSAPLCSRQPSLPVSGDSGGVRHRPQHHGPVGALRPALRRCLGPGQEVTVRDTLFKTPLTSLNLCLALWGKQYPNITIRNSWCHSGTRSWFFLLSDSEDLVLRQKKRYRQLTFSLQPVMRQRNLSSDTAKQSN